MEQRQFRNIDEVLRDVMNDEHANIFKEWDEEDYQKWRLQRNKRRKNARRKKK